MKTDLSNLLSPLAFSSLHLKNRIVLAPMTRSRAGKENIANPLLAEYYQQRSTAGLLITEGTFISPQAIGWLNVPGIYTHEHAEAWKKTTSAVHAADTPIFLQLWHCGRASHSSFHGGQLPVAPSAIKINGDTIHTSNGKQTYETPRALETNEIAQIVADYKNAAKLAKLAGFDGVEIHSANGYLLDEFLQSKTNKREDNYGGSLANRYRILREVIEAVCTEFPSNRIGVRLAPNGVYNDMGSPDYRETFLYVAEQLNKLNIGYLHLLDGLAFGFHNLGEPMKLSEFRQVFKGIIMGNCGYTAETADEAIAKGDADLISFGRPFISNPDLVERFTNGWELNPTAEMSDWYSFDAHGYTDFPTHEQAAQMVSSKP